MDQTSRAVPHRRARRGLAYNEAALTSDSQHSRLWPAEGPAETQACEQGSKSSGWSRIYTMPNIIMLQIAWLLRSIPIGTWGSGSLVRSVAACFVFLYLAFGVISFRPYVVYLKLQHWETSSTPQQSAFSVLFPGSQTPALGIMEASLVFSKLVPHLGNLGPSALQPILRTDSQSMKTSLPITACVWIPSTHLETLDYWTELSGCEISVLITSSYAPGSPDHQRLVKEIHNTIKQKPRLKGSIVLLSTPTRPLNLNTYTNLARLFSKSPWSLLIPPEPALLPMDGFSQSISELELRTHTTDPRLTFKMPGTEVNSSLGGVLIPRDSPVWCPEQYSVLAPEQDWSTCIQELLRYHDSS